MRPVYFQVAFLKQPNIIDILKERFPSAATSQSIKDKVNSIRNDGMSALERYGVASSNFFYLSMNKVNIEA